MYTEQQVKKMLDEIFTAVDSADTLAAIAAETTFDIVRDELRKIADENCDHSVGLCYCQVHDALDGVGDWNVISNSR